MATTGAKPNPPHPLRTHVHTRGLGTPAPGEFKQEAIPGLKHIAEETTQNPDERRYRRANEHLDAAAGVDGIEAFYAQCAANGATNIKPLTPTLWGTKDFYVEDPDG